MKQSLKINLFEALQTAKKKAEALKKDVIFSYVEKSLVTTPLQFYCVKHDCYQGERFFWQDADEEMTLVGLGNNLKFQGSHFNEQRFKKMDANWNNKSFEYIEIGEKNILGTGPICFGGFSFQQNNQQINSIWSQFGSYLFIVPKFLYTENACGNYITATLLLNEKITNEDIEQFVQEFEDLMSKLTDFQHGLKPLPNITAIEESYIKEWKHNVTKITESIKAGDLEKVVFARELELYFESVVSPGAVIANLQEQQPKSYIFSLENNADCFIGASPERLIKKTDAEVFSACVAGSIKRGDTNVEDIQLANELLEDEKNVKEHQFVVQMIQSIMNTLCSEINMADSPKILKNRHIQHLYTPIQGTSKPDVSILEFVSQLHPTPAMGGVPLHKALEKINEYERIDRGFYAAPIGWMDIQGNGEFAVGIRSGLLNGAKATLFAGCGIVEHSEPDQEYFEAKVKFKPMFSALGGKLHDL